MSAPPVLLLAAHPCAECLTTPRRIVSGERAAEIVKACRADGTHFVCHKSRPGEIVHCRGVHDQFGSDAHRFAVANGIEVREVDPDAPDMLAGVSPTQLRALRELARQPMPTCGLPMAGYGRGPILSACRALVRRGFMWTYRTGSYGLTDAGVPLAREALRRWRAQRQAEKDGAA
jgi:hypothetical protein